MIFLKNFLMVYALGLAFAVFALWLQDWFGASDLSVFAFWQGLYALFLSLIGTKLMKTLRGKSSGVRLAWGVVLGFFLAVVFLLVFVIVFGMWAGAMSVPLLPIWLATGLVAGAIMASGYSGKALLFFTLGLMLVKFFPLLVSQATGSERLTFCSTSYKEGGGFHAESCGTYGPKDGQTRFIYVVTGHKDTDWVKIEIPKHNDLMIYSQDGAYQTFPKAYEGTGRFVHLLNGERFKNKIETTNNGTVGSY